jgi:hypothetical protein
MVSKSNPVHRRQVSDAVDLVSALDTAAIEHLRVNDRRTVVIYQDAILILVATEGRTTAARTFTVELWDLPAHSSNSDPNRLLTSFLDDVLATVDD